MHRINDAKILVSNLYEEYTKQLNLPPKQTLNVECAESIEKAFQSVYTADLIATRNKTPFPRALTQKLRKAFADLLLLMDGKDIKEQAVEIKTNNEETQWK